MTARNPIVLINGRLQELPAGDTLNGVSGGGGGGGLTTADLATSGTTVLDFGSAPGSQIAVTRVLGQTTLGANSQIDAWIMGVDSADHNAYEHMIAPIRVSAGNLVAGEGFDVMGVSPVQLTGQFAVQWVRTQ